MLDIDLIRDRTEWVKEQIVKLNDTAPIDEIVQLDERRRTIIHEVEKLRRQRNEASKLIGRWMGELSKLKRLQDDAKATQQVGDAVTLRGDEASLVEKVEEVKEDTRRIGDQISQLDQELREVVHALEENMLWVPNLPHESVPVAPDDSHNVPYEPEGAPKPQFEFTPKAHWDLGPQLGIIDFERGVKLSGSRFYLLNGWGARLQRALIQFMLDFHVTQHGYLEIYPPFMVHEECFVGAAQLPKFADNIYYDAEEDFMWLGTAEIALTNIHRDEILDGQRLPLKYVAYSPCFRREKMSAGRDVRGIKRGHQFDKVEMYRFTTPEESYEALQEMVQEAIAIARTLNLPYRLVEIVTGDLGFAAAKKYDLEVWAAGSEEWLEVSSISNCEAFQARRANIRYRPDGGGKPRFPHTLNGSGLALPRVMIAILENNQRGDGTIHVPAALRKYLGIEVIEGVQSAS